MVVAGAVVETTLGVAMYDTKVVEVEVTAVAEEDMEAVATVEEDTAGAVMAEEEEDTGVVEGTGAVETLARLTGSSFLLGARFHAVSIQKLVFVSFWYHTSLQMS